MIIKFTDKQINHYVELRLYNVSRKKATRIKNILSSEKHTLKPLYKTKFDLILEVIGGK